MESLQFFIVNQYNIDHGIIQKSSSSFHVSLQKWNFSSTYLRGWTETHLQLWCWSNGKGICSTSILLSHDSLLDLQPSNWLKQLEKQVSDHSGAFMIKGLNSWETNFKKHSLRTQNTHKNFCNPPAMTCHSKTWKLQSKQSPEILWLLGRNLPGLEEPTQSQKATRCLLIDQIVNTESAGKTPSLHEKNECLPLISLGWQNAEMH